MITSGAWNGAGQLTTYGNSSADMTAATYDGIGLRASSTITPSGGSPVTENYVWAGMNLLMDSDNAYIYASGIAPVEQVSLSTGTVTYLVTDALGSVRGTINSSGDLTGTVSYDAWGNPSTPGGFTAITPFGFAGGYTDPDDLIYLQNRYYDPRTGQFTSVDPDLSQTLQPYAYTAGDPVSQVDPSGLAVVNLKGTASWALRRAYSSYNGFHNDCAEFVSRALFNGGKDYMNWPPLPWVDEYKRDNKYWWFLTSPRQWSYSWTVAYSLADHLYIRKSLWLKYWNEGEQIGDLVFADWNGNSFSNISHVGVITSIVRGVPHITQHSPTQPHVSILYWLKHGGTDVHVWVVRPNKG